MIEEKQVIMKDPKTGVLAYEGTTYIIPPNPEMGYTCGYSIFVPKNCETDTTLLITCFISF